jgi:hypothetical protein
MTGACDSDGAGRTDGAAVVGADGAGRTVGSAVATGDGVTVGTGVDSAWAGETAGSDAREMTSAATSAVFFRIEFTFLFHETAAPLKLSEAAVGDREVRQVYGRHAVRSGNLHETFGLSPESLPNLEKRL